jgi:hypothetical protein
VIDEEEATGLGSSDDANGYGTTCGDLSRELLAGDWMLLPLRLVGPLVVADGYQGPVVGNIDELAEKIGGHIATERRMQCDR